MIRLDKFVCDATGCSRSQAKRLIKSGCVTVNQTPVFTPDSKIKEGEDAVAADGRTLNLTGKVYYLLHKPAGVVSASRDAVSETVLDLLKGAPGRDLFPVGRLDKDTEGLLLLTNDGALAHRLLAPGRHVEKTYLVRTDRPVTQEMLDRLAQGVDIGDETPTRPAKAAFLPAEPNGLYLTLTEGRYHQVKRMLHAVGAEVTYLKRLSMGPLTLEGTLPKGSWRNLTEQEKRDLGVS